MSVDVGIVKAMLAMASKDESQQALSGIRCEESGEIVATDGKVMGWIKREENGSPLRTRNLRRDTLEAAIKIAPVSVIYRGADLDAEKIGDVTLADYPEPEYRYAEWRRAIPTAAPAFHLRFSRPVLETLVKAMRASKTGYITFGLPEPEEEEKDGKKVIRKAMTMTMGPIKGVVMPATP